jgi:HEPN domain-containing protein
LVDGSSRGYTSRRPFGGDYSYSLFFGHLAIEKLLKGLYAAKLRQHAPPIHNLLRLAKVAGLELDESVTDALITVTAFNIETRYPDVKRAFRQKCTAEYTKQQLTMIRGLIEWLMSRMP